MTGSTSVHPGADRFRVVPWRGRGEVVLIAPVPGAAPPGPEGVRHCVDALARRGVREVVTGALAPAEQPAFLAAGFDVREHLHLLAHDLRDLPVPSRPVRLRRGRRSDRPAVLDVDRLAFEEFWRLDDVGLTDALEATLASRFRIAGDRRPVGYAVTGRAGPRGYLQRLAVRPDHHGRGIAATLVADGLRWLRRHGCESAAVNTQHRNVTALAVYEHLGFRRQPEGLVVLSRTVGPPG